MAVACYAAGGDLLDGGVDGVEEGFGFGGAGGHLVGCDCGYGVMVLGVGMVWFGGSD